ncbi:hypothetical protein FF1_037977 [Malus domestica]
MAKWLNPDDVVDTRGWGDFDIIKDQGPNHKRTMMPQGTFPTGAASFGEWTKTAPIRDVVETNIALTIGVGEMRPAGAVRIGLKPTSQINVSVTGSEENKEDSSSNGPRPQGDGISIKQMEEEMA